jgi:hypothetical protein
MPNVSACNHTPGVVCPRQSIASLVYHPSFSDVDNMQDEVIPHLQFLQPKHQLKEQAGL